MKYEVLEFRLTKKTYIIFQEILTLYPRDKTFPLQRELWKIPLGKTDKKIMIVDSRGVDDFFYILQFYIHYLFDVY